MAALRRPFSHLARALPWTLLTAAILLARIAWPPRDLDATGAVALRDLSLTLLLMAITAVLAHGLGEKLLHLLAPPDLTRLEGSVFSLALGLGALGYLMFGLGMIGLLNTAWITGSILGLSLWVGPQWRAAPGRVRRALSAIHAAWRSAEPLARISAVLAAVIGILAFIHSLSPPWDYDGLMYHLVGPQLFLREGRILPYPDNWYVNAPFTLEMVFSLGMAYGDDVFPKLIHFSSAVLLVLATYAAGRRWLGERGGWLSAAILLGVPTLPIWASFAYIDLGWALYEFLALVAGLVWWQSRSRRWLGMSAVFIGLAMGTKYLGLMGLAVLGVFVALAAAREGRTGWLRTVGGFGLIAALVGGPWYLKNLIWFGNPVFPLYFGGPGWPSERLSLYNAYLSSFGTGRGLLAYLLIPFNVYARHALFGTMMNRIDVPALIFPILLAYPLMPRHRVISLILWMALARVVLWAFGSQQIRFLLPIYPGLAVSAAYVASNLVPRKQWRLPWPMFLPLLSVALMVPTLFYQVVVQAQFNPALAAIGAESRREFLSRALGDFEAVRFVEEELPGTARALLLGDGRGYYCPDRCLPDPDHFRWSAEIAALEGEEALAGWFADRGITHVLLSLEDLDFLLQHDPAGVVRTALERLVSWREAGCLEEVFRDEWASIYAVQCHVSPSQ